MRYLTICWALTALVRSAAAEPAPPQLELLHAAPATVAVSSTVANARILPAHLVDGDPATAWNSRTGDLVGAWIAFRVPRGARVTAIRMTAGFTAKDKQGDLFTMNARIREVRLYRDGALLGQHELDIEARSRQELAVNADGGDFKIEIAEIVPGTKPTWREVCVSELEVLGTLPAGSQPSRTNPVVRVGSLDEPVKPAATSAGASPRQPPREPVLLVVPSTAATTLSLGKAADTYTAAGPPIVLALRASSTKSKRREVTAMQPIAASPEQTAMWLGRALQLEGKDGPACTGTISGLGVVSSTSFWSETATLDQGTFANVIWQGGRKFGRMLVAIVAVSPGTSCAGALWAHDPARKVQRRAIETQQFRKVLFDNFLAPGGPFDSLHEQYVLDDLDAEYGDAAKNEQQIPVDERLTEGLVRRTFKTYAACDPGARCIGLILGSYTKHHVAIASVIDGGVVGAHRRACGYALEPPLVAADVDGDGAVDLLYPFIDYETRTIVGIGVVGRAQTTSLDLTEGPCSWSD